jgi:hypothetical protein
MMNLFRSNVGSLDSDLKRLYYLLGFKLPSGCQVPGEIINTIYKLLLVNPILETPQAALDSIPETTAFRQKSFVHAVRPVMRLQRFFTPRTRSFWVVWIRASPGPSGSTGWVLALPQDTSLTVLISLRTVILQFPKSAIRKSWSVCIKIIHTKLTNTVQSGPFVDFCRAMSQILSAPHKFLWFPKWVNSANMLAIDTIPWGNIWNHYNFCENLNTSLSEMPTFLKFPDPSLTRTTVEPNFAKL